MLVNFSGTYTVNKVPYNGTWANMGWGIKMPWPRATSYTCRKYHRNKKKHHVIMIFFSTNR